MKEKKISIIIPAYNEEERLSLCLDSVFFLDYPNDDFEVILVDNGSSDRTRDIAETYKVKVLRDDFKNVSGLRNLGAKQANGAILAFLDADCIVLKRWLQNASKYFDEQEIVAWGAPPVIPENATWVQKTWYLVRQKEDEIQPVDWLESMNFFVRKAQFLDVGGFNESLVTCEDVDFCYRICKYGKIISDSNINVIHLGEASTVKEFIHKEMWRGQSNLKGIFSHGFVWKELPSLSIPIYFGLVIPSFFIFFCFSMNPIWILAALFFSLIPSAAAILKVRNKIHGFWEAVKLFFLVQVYFFSRTAAILKKN